MNRKITSKSVILIFVIVWVSLFVVSCKKSDSDAQQGSSGSDAVVATEQQLEAPDTSSEQMMPLQIELPKPMFVGTPPNLQGVTNLEPARAPGESRPDLLVPEGTVNLAAGKMVLSTSAEPIIGEFEMITDGDKEAADGSYVELDPFLQSVTIDLEQKSEIYAVVVWHYHKEPRVYFDVIVQVSDDPDFITGVTTLFNNDDDNSSGLGVGQDKNYIETYEGKLIDAKGVRGQYVRLNSNGNNNNELNHYIEVDVYGKPVQ